MEPLTHCPDRDRDRRCRAARVSSLEGDREPSRLLPHYLLKVDLVDFVRSNFDRNPGVPAWVLPELQRIPVVVVRRGTVEQDRVPVGIRGLERSQRWAAYSPIDAIQQVVTPVQLLEGLSESSYSERPPIRGLRDLMAAWRWFTRFDWGPGGSLGFELATGSRVTTTRSDLDIIIYADRYLPRSDAQKLFASASALNLALDARVETPACGFSLVEYAVSSGGLILLRTSIGPVLGNDPWHPPKSPEARLDDK
jgi:phosphoribosyl-dephospho-CoA transferase